MSPPAEAQTPEIRVKFEGTEVPAVEVGFRVEKEDWASYQIEDGSIVKMKNSVSRVLKLIGRTKDDGSPIYVIEGSSLVTTIVPGMVVDVPQSISSMEEEG